MGMSHQPKQNDTKKGAEMIQNLTETVTGFGSIDVYIIANRFTTAQLRQELHHAESEASIDQQFEGTEYVSDFPWADYVDVCKEALTWKRPKKSQSNYSYKIDVDQIKHSHDIVEVVEGYTTLRKSGSNFSGKCPIHNDKTPSMVVYPDNQSWHCFGCNKGGDVIRFIQSVEGTDFKGAIAILGSR